MKSLAKAVNANRPLLIQPSVARDYLASVESSVAFPPTAKLSDVSEMLEAVFGQVPTLEIFPPYAIIPIKGVIGKHLTALEKACGGCDLHDVEENLEAAERDQRVKTIIFKVDSPGGTSVGVPELANRIVNCKKSTIAFTSNEACSAAYWLASQCEQVYATPSASVGSIGCYIAYLDESQAFADEGLKVDVIKSGKFKGAGIPGTSLDDAQRMMLQEEVSEIHEEFKSAVKAVRTFASDESMEARIYSGKKAAENGLVTGLVNGWDELMESLDAAVAEQMEADEDNDEREEEAEEGEAKAHAPYCAAKSALGKYVESILKPSSLKVTIETDEDEDDKDKEDEAEEATPDPEEKDAEEEKKDGEAPQADLKSEDDEDEDDKKEADDSEAKKHADSGASAVDTDEKHEKKSDEARHRKGSKIG